METGGTARHGGTMTRRDGKPHSRRRNNPPTQVLRAYTRSHFTHTQRSYTTRYRCCVFVPRAATQPPDRQCGGSPGTMPRNDADNSDIIKSFGSRRFPLGRGSDVVGGSVLLACVCLTHSLSHSLFLFHMTSLCLSLSLSERTTHHAIA